MCSSRASTFLLLWAAVSRSVPAGSPLVVRRPHASVWTNYSPACDVSLPLLCVVEYGGKFYRAARSTSETKSRCCKRAVSSFTPPGDRPPHHGRGARRWDRQNEYQ